VLGGLVFNIGNIGGTALGMNAMLGVDAKVGGAVSAAIAIAIFLSRRAGLAMDRIVVVLGLVMIAMVTYVAIASDPPVGEALQQTVLPSEVNFLVITTLIGGTVGGYITYAGAHRLVDSGITGSDHVRQITRGSVTGIVVTGVMRALLFLAVLGVVAGGASLATDNPPATAFEVALGEVGVRVFGVILWAASITSVIGASYTSVSFMTGFLGGLRERRHLVVVGFIAVCATLFLVLGQAPVTLLVLAGALNGLILPVGLAVILWVAARRTGDLLGGYRYPRWLLGLGIAVWLLTVYLGWQSLGGISELWA
jgi:Mn2+/Fe2+ NRAMP family transporter